MAISSLRIANVEAALESKRAALEAEKIKAFKAFKSTTVSIS